MSYAAARNGLDIWYNLPTDLQIADTLPQRSIIYAADGSIIATFYGQNRIPVDISEIPPVFINAILATEDARFFEHRGVDWQAMLRAVANNVQGGAIQGGSGITQQYVKNLFILNSDTAEKLAEAREITIDRKLREARFAMALEQKLTKEEILEGYLNAVYFGDGAYGIGAAAQHYFNKKPADLTLGEAALLAGIINAPTAYNPVDNLERSRERRVHVLGRMAAEGFITEREARRIAKEPIKLDLVYPPNGCYASPYPLYCQWVKQILESDPVFGETSEQRQDLLHRGGLRIYTALDPKIQDEATAAARAALAGNGRIATALAVVEPGTGKVLALATNKKFGIKAGRTELLLPVLPAYQHGSTFKPFTAAAALETGLDPELRFTSQTTYIPEGRNYPEGGFKNFGNGPGGDYDIAGALRHSNNTWFVELEDQIGVRRVAKLAYDMGLTALPLEGERAISEKDASLTLGAYEASPLQVASAYATFAAQGKACQPIGITKVIGPNNANLDIPEANCRRVIKASTANTMTAMLATVVDGSDAGRTGIFASLGKRPVAGKTGSTNGFGAAWFAGYTPQYSTAVWVGDPRGPQFDMEDGVSAYKGTRFFAPVYGGSIPALIFQDTMTRIHEGLPIRQFPSPGGAVALGATTFLPDVRGLNPENAIGILERYGFTARVRTGGKAIPGIPAGTITEMSPRPGKWTPQAGQEITLLMP
jgi:membrane peptidoglycan carboxypeptidase